MARDSVAEEYDQKQREEIVRTLTETKDASVATMERRRVLGINRTTLLSRMKKLGINPKQFS